MGDHLREVVRIVNIDTYGQVVDNPLEYVEDKAVEDDLFQENDIDVFLEKNRRIGSNVYLILLFLTSITSETSYKDMGKCFSDHSTKRVDTLVLSVDLNAHFNRQPCRFVRKDISISLRELIDQCLSQKGFWFLTLVVVMPVHW